MSDSVVVPGPRDVRASLDAPTDATDHAVVACPPHPQMGGSRSDSRLQAVGEALVEQGVACLRFDYGPWDEGAGEVVDCGRALDWARERFDRVSLFGYSFGGAVALLAAARADPTPERVAVLSPAADLGTDRESAAALEDIDCPVQVVYGERDTTVDWEPTVERAAALGHDTVGVPADHFYVGQVDRVADLAASFLATGTSTEF
jgi:alpha/beta superfamily hydrolase